MKHLISIPFVCACFACGESDTEYKSDLVQNMHDSIAADLADLSQAARDLQAAAPTPADRGWDATLDADAIASMKSAWLRCRTAYEHVEGATAPIFPESDYAMDARYDDYLATLGPAGDPDPFDGVGATGMHSIERILYADQIDSTVVAFESALPGYAPAAFPATAAQAMELETGLVQQLIDDADTLHAQWQPAAIDIGAAFQGLVSLMNEQKEKVNKAATGEEESRYSQTTLFDLRNNLDGTSKIYALFRPWFAAKVGDTGMDADGDALIEDGFDHLAMLYNNDPGDALPAVPATWSSDTPSASDLSTPFGVLWAQVHAAVDPTVGGTIVFEMNEAADVLGFPEFVEM